MKHRKIRFDIEAPDMAAHIQDLVDVVSNKVDELSLLMSAITIKDPVKVESYFKKVIFDTLNLAASTTGSYLIDNTFVIPEAYYRFGVCGSHIWLSANTTGKGTKDSWKRVFIVAFDQFY